MMSVTFNDYYVYYALYCGFLFRRWTENIPIQIKNNNGNGKKTETFFICMAITHINKQILHFFSQFFYLFLKTLLVLLYCIAMLLNTDHGRK